jgi:hypothetical protein
MTALTVYYANAASSVVGTANQLYHNGAGSPSTAQPTSTFGTQTQYIEIYSQGGSGLTGAGSIGSPSGHGFFLDDSTLDGQDVSVGSWSATVRFVAMQLGAQAGSMTADIIVRAYRYRSGTYTQIISMTLAAQTINSNLANYSLSGSSSSPIGFVSGDHLYTDVWVNITAGSGNANQGIRINRESTDTSTKIGDALASIATAGFLATPARVPFVVGSGMLPGYFPASGGSL